MGRILKILGTTAVQSINVLLLQICTLTLLIPSRYGIFSIAYLFSAMCTSLVMSVVSEAWQRQHAQARWGLYSWTLVWLSIICGAIGLVIGVVVEPLRDIAVASAIAVAANSYRVGARYFSSHENHLKDVLRGDLASLGVLVLSVAALLITRPADPLIPLVWIWSVSCLAAALFSPRPRWLLARGATTWLRTHKRHIKTLYADSLLLDAANIGIPYLMAPVLGASGFGVYRGMSSLTGPVKLVLFPLRPYFGKIPARRWGSLKFVALTLGSAAVAGALAALGLMILESFKLNLGTLSALSEHVLPTAIFFGSTLANGVYYLAARSHLSGRGLLIGRVATAICLIVFPPLGLLVGGLNLALWGAVAANMASVVVWMALFWLPEARTIQESA